MSGTISLAALVDSLLQKAYHDLTVLAELLPRKSDGDRKVEIVQFARKTRLLLIRLLALVKWAGNSGNVQKCSELSALLNRQAGQYVDTADQLFDLSRRTLVQACTPNFSLAPALDVLVLGAYPRLPSCIREKTVNPPPLSSQEQLGAFSLLDCAIRRRLGYESVPEAMKVTHIGKGLVTFIVPSEFELSLSVVSDELTVPWRLVDLHILVGEALPGKPVLLHECQRLYLHRLLQSRLFGGDAPLLDCYQLLHTFCLNLKLDCLHSQAQQLSSEVCGGYVKVDEYVPGQHMRVAYWRPMGATQFLSAFLLNQARVWPRVVVTVDPSNKTQPFSISHVPPLSDPWAVDMTPGRLSMEDILALCVAARSRTMVKEMRESLRGTSWEGQVCESQLCMSVSVRVKYGRREVLLGVDPRVGNIVASVEPPCTSEGVQRCLGDLEKAVTASRESLPAQLSTLQCQLFLAHLAEQATELGLAVSWSLPLDRPLPLHTSSSLLYVQVQPLAYLVVGVAEGLVDHAHLLQLAPTFTLPQSSVDTGDTSPQSFYTATSLLELDTATLQTQRLHAILVSGSTPRLKRKLRECGLHLPCSKRLCVRPMPWFGPTPALVRDHLSLQYMQTSLHAAGISAHHITYSQFGAPCVHIFRFPSLAVESSDIHDQLSSHLQSCRVSPTNHNYHCRLVFSAVLPCQGGRQSTLCITLPSDVDVGQSLLHHWQAKISLLGLALEMQHYLQDNSWLHHSRCAITGFTYDTLTLEFGPHTMVVTAGGGEGLHLRFSDGCPHAEVAECLERFLDMTRSLPLLLQGLWATEGVMCILDEFVKSVPDTSVTASTPAQIQLRYDSLPPNSHGATVRLTVSAVISRSHGGGLISHGLLSGRPAPLVEMLLTTPTSHGRLQLQVESCVRMSLRADSTVQLTDITYGKPILGGVHVSAPNYLQVFLRSSLLGVQDAEETLPLPPSHPPPAGNKPVLMPCPSPITSPRLSPWPGSPLPSIPSLPSPRETPLGSQPGVMFTASTEQFKQLFAVVEAEGCSPMEGFLGGLAQLYQFVQQASHEKYQQIQPSLQFVSCDRGVYTYRADTLVVSLSLDMGTVPTLKLGIKPAQENVWSPADLEVISKFFKAEVARRPFSGAAMLGFVRILLLPLPTLRSCVQLMQMHMVPLSGAVWRISLCLTVPQGIDLPEMGTSSLGHGSVGVVFRGKLLLVVKMTHIQGDGGEHVLLLLYDPKTNQTFLPANSRGTVRSALFQAVDTVLKKTYQDHQSGHPRPDSSTLFASLKALSLATLPV